MDPMAAEHTTTTSVTTVPAAAENEQAAMKSPTAADPVRWEFRLTADRRRILIPVSQTTDPGLV
jgi:hypothetical protein